MRIEREKKRKMMREREKKRKMRRERERERDRSIKMRENEGRYGVPNESSSKFMMA